MTSLSCQKDGQLKNKICFKKRCIDVEVMQTHEQHMRGMQFRKNLDRNSGMLFVFEHSYRASFWMKDTWIPLDIIWINQSKKIVHIVRKASPCTTTPCPTYTPPEEARYVLEVNAGYADTLGLRVGDFIKI